MESPNRSISSIKQGLHLGYLIASGLFISYSLITKFILKQNQQEQVQSSKTNDDDCAFEVGFDRNSMDNSVDQRRFSMDSDGEYDMRESRASNCDNTPKQSGNQSQVIGNKPLISKSRCLPSKNATSSVLSLKELGTVLPESIVEKEFTSITKVCLTGGPCAGKTSGLAYLSEKLRDDDLRVFMVPEAATLLANGGGMLDFEGYSSDDILAFQKVLMQVQICLEDAFFALAKLSRTKSMLLCDRGLLDGKAFMENEQWLKLLRDLEFSEQYIRDHRYDSVIHMVTAADGANEHYKMEGARFQTEQQAIQVDRKFQDAWLGHQSLEVIDNRSVRGFVEKLNKLLFTVRRNSGVPVKGDKLYKRFVIFKDGSLSLPSDLQVERFDIEDVFLYNPGYDEMQGKLTKVRKRMHKGEEIYLCSESHVIDGKRTMFFKKRLNFREYLLVKDRSDRDRLAIRKNRCQFIYNGYFYSLDEFKEFSMSILRLKQSCSSKLLNDQNERVIPDFLNIDAEITMAKEFKSVQLSLKSSPLRDPNELKRIIYELSESTKKETISFAKESQGLKGKSLFFGEQKFNED